MQSLHRRPAEAPAETMEREIADVADPRVEALVHELIGRVADKWTMLILETLEEKGELRFTQLSREIGTISQKMLTQTLRQMERDGLIKRTIHAVVPPKVEYRLTGLGKSLGAAFCGVWIWAEENLAGVHQARDAFEQATKA
ncbi:HxlR family transcriptional regulator [Rhizobium sp. PP-F2F-G36]|nr:HxlR family transcriptional regulator [Rhizobium sp. PP-F2F-G36]